MADYARSVMKNIKRATTDWRARLEPMLIEKIATPPQTDRGTTQLTEEPSKMAEHAEDLSPKTSRPGIGTTLPPVAIPPGPSPPVQTARDRRNKRARHPPVRVLMK